MIVRYACRYTDGRTVRGEVVFDESGQATITRADDSYIRQALESALSSTIEYTAGEVRDGALTSVPVIAKPGTVEHAIGMVNPLMLLAAGIVVVQIEDPF